MLDGNLLVSHSQVRDGTYRRKGDMMASSRPAITAPPQRWELLGALLEARRRNLGYATRAVFESERQVQAWLAAAFEKATRRSIDPDRLRFLGRAYGFTYESAVALLNDKADELAFVPPEPLPGPERKHYAVPPDRLRPIERAPLEGRRLLGVLLAQRRAELGYTHWPAFARARLPLTDSGNPNTRLLADIEKAYRDNFPEPRLRQLARAYQVDYHSLTDVAHLRADALVPAPPASAPAGLPAHAPPPAGQDGWQPPIADKARRDADAPYAMEIMERLLALADSGVIDPSGAQVFPGAPGDAKAWDGIGGRLDVRDRVWFIADLRRRADGRDPDSGTGVTGA